MSDTHKSAGLYQTGQGLQIAHFRKPPDFGYFGGRLIVSRYFITS